MKIIKSPWYRWHKTMCVSFRSQFECSCMHIRCRRRRGSDAAVKYRGACINQNGVNKSNDFKFGLCVCVWFLFSATCILRFRSGHLRFACPDQKKKPHRCQFFAFISHMPSKGRKKKHFLHQIIKQKNTVERSIFEREMSSSNTVYEVRNVHTREHEMNNMSMLFVLFLLSLS